ncbi:sulfatase [Bacteroidota bacterium]
MKKEITRVISIMTAGLSIVFTLYSCKPAADNSDNRPNVILILGDDMSSDDFGFINGKALTPNLDRMAQEGLYFSRTYVPSAACTPSRFSVLTGRFGSRCQAPGFINSATEEGVYSIVWNTLLSHEPDILSRTMKEAGYRTGITGKWHNGFPPESGRLAGMLNYEDDPSDPRVDSLLKALDRTNTAHLQSLGFDYARGLVYNNYDVHPLKVLQYHNQEEITQLAVDFIRQNKDNPFFLYIPTTLMHAPSPGESLDADPRATFSGLMDEPIKLQPSREDVIGRTREAGIEGDRAGATWLDDGIGVVLTTLEEFGLDKNTLVIFMDDQGMDGGKASCYEGGVRVPSIYYWPGRIKPGTSEAMVANIDIYPTICEICNIAIDPGNHDGKSLWPLIDGKQESVRDLMYCEFAYSRAIVTEDFKYLAFRLPPSKQMTHEERVAFTERELERVKARHIRSFIPKPDAPLSPMGWPGGQTTERESPILNYPHFYDTDQLYDLRNDPNEQVNLADDPAYAVQLQEMKRMLSEWVEKMPGTFGEF